MKKILKPLFCAAALVSLAGCNKFDEANATPETSNGSLIKVYANVAENDGTRANINVGESVFTAEWEAGDALGILPVKTGGTAPATAAKFAYNARPRAVRFKYHATIGEVNYNLHGGKIPVGEMDKARIFVCIVDWTAQQKVFAGTKAPTGTWDPETQTEAANGPIIGYASKFIEETTQGDEMVEVILPINYYQDTAAAPDGKYNIVVSCSTSAYGDYMDACTTNVMYVDDFEWVY